MGYWLPHTATVDWCEDNYVVTQWIVEFWNSASSLFFCAGALYCGLASWRRGRFAPRFWLSYAMLGLVGVGSALFHGTLQYRFQLLDELPMIFGVAHQIYSLHYGNVLLQAALVALCGSFSFLYVFVHRDPNMHELLFVALELYFVYRYWRTLMRLNVARRKHPARLLRGGIALASTGALFWFLDNLICHHLAAGKRFLGALSAIFELHAWWHILSSLGVLWLLSGTIALCYELEGLAVNVSYKYHLLPVFGIGRPGQSRCESPAAAPADMSLPADPVYATMHARHQAHRPARALRR